MYYDDHHIFSHTERVFNMPERHLRIVTALAVCFIVDLLRPFGYSIYCDFLYLGIISIYLIYPYFPALFWGVVFGYLKDTCSMAQTPVNIIEFAFIFLLTRYLFGQFPENASRRFIPAIIIAIHLWLNIQYLAKASIFFDIKLVMQYILLFILVNNLLKKWMKFRRDDYT